METLQENPNADVKQPPTSTCLPIDQIQVGQRHRKDLGDIVGLAASIDRLGLLQPIPITPEYRLIAGERRLAALRHLGRTEVPIVIVSHLDDALHLLQAERDENQCRQDFTPSEAVAMGKAIEAIEAPQAKQRQREHSGRPKKSAGKLPPISGKGKTRDKVAKAVGMSGRNFDKAKAVVKAAEADPERFGHAVEQMDKTGKVDPAYQEVKGHRATVSKKNASNPRKTIADNGKAETITIGKPTTTADKKALATTLLKFLGHAVFEEISQIALQQTSTPTTKSVPATPVNKPKPRTPANKSLPATPVNKPKPRTPANKTVPDTPVSKQTLLRSMPASRRKSEDDPMKDMFDG